VCAPSVIEHVSVELSRRRFLQAAGVAAASILLPWRLAPAQAASPEAARSLSFTHVADLTHTLTPDFPVFPSFEGPKLETRYTVERDGFYARQWVVAEHTGTHLDAPAHFVAGPDMWTADQIPLENLVAPLVVVSIEERAARDHDAQVTVDDLLAWEREHGPIPKGAAVCMYSGWERRLANPVTFTNADSGGTMHFPGFSLEAAQFLVHEREVVGIGVDTLSLDIGPSTDFAVHLEVLGASKWGLENLANLATVPPAGATLIAGVPKVQGASGGPTRVLAVW